MSDKKEFCFISVIGRDRKGIVAKISTLLYESEVNIEDMAQKITQGYFTMTMLVDITSASLPLEGLKTALEDLGEELGLQIQIQHENIFKAMHRI